MASPIPLVLSLTGEQQLDFQHCGPAVARMILSHFGMTPPQATLWAEIQARSAGPVGPPYYPTPLFPKQVCHQCSGNWHCWVTSPEAMAAAIQDRASLYTGSAAHYPATKIDAVVAQIESLERTGRFPPAVTIRAANHWVVVAGHHLEDPLLPGVAAEQIGNYRVSGMYVMNPFDTVPTVNFVSIPDWRARLRSMDCGPYQGRYPMVVGTTLSFLIKWWIYILAFLLRLFPRPWWRSA